MIHTNFCGIRSTVSREEDFEGVLPYMGMAAVLVLCTGLIGPVVSEKSQFHM